MHKSLAVTRLSLLLLNNISAVSFYHPKPTYDSFLEHYSCHPNTPCDTSAFLPIIRKGLICLAVNNSEPPPPNLCWTLSLLAPLSILLHFSLPSFYNKEFLPYPSLKNVMWPPLFECHSQLLSSLRLSLGSNSPQPLSSVRKLDLGSTLCVGWGTLYTSLSLSLFFLKFSPPSPNSFLNYEKLSVLFCCFLLPWGFFLFQSLIKH